MYRRFIKRFLDLLVAVLMLPFWFVLFIVVGPLIYVADRGTIFYNAPRLGKSGKTFTMYKFRSMKMNAPDIRNTDGTTFNSDNDPRVTRIGNFMRKTSIDESPQILNIIKGDMSFVGPRPDLPNGLSVYRGNEKRKLDVLPGITGYSQAYYRNDIELHERFAQDVYYVDNVSFLLDAKIVLKTISTVLLRKGVYRNQGVAR